jgi:hypothetical protein
MNPAGRTLLARVGSNSAFMNVLGVDRNGFKRLVSKFKLHYKHKFKERNVGRRPCQDLVRASARNASSILHRTN